MKKRERDLSSLPEGLLELMIEARKKRGGELPWWYKPGSASSTEGEPSDIRAEEPGLHRCRICDSDTTDGFDRLCAACKRQRSYEETHNEE